MSRDQPSPPAAPITDAPEGGHSAQASPRAEAERFRNIADSLPVIVWTIDQGGSCTYVNRGWYEYTGQAPGDGEGSGWHTCVHPDDLAATAGRMESAMSRREPFRIEYRLRRSDGAWRWMLDAGAPWFDGAEFLGYVGSIVDIDDRLRAEARAHHLAHHDPLTGLANRALFHDRLRQALAEAGDGGQRVGLLLLDLDRFKEVNDNLGHDAGDALLREAGERLRGCVREGDTVARLGGDEFAVVLPRLPASGVAAAIATKIAAALAEPVSHAGLVVRAAASIGVAMFPDDGEEAGQLVKSADVALYRAKAEGGGGHRFFGADMRAQVERRRAVEVELRHALAEGTIVPFFQPIVRLEDGRAIGFEALARWLHPERGIVAPAEFLPIAEEAGLIAPLSEAVLRQALAQARAWQDRGVVVGHVAVNVVGAQFRRGGLAATVRGALADFGTGHASLVHLKRFPVGLLKVDRSFVRDMLDDPSDAAIVRAVVGLSRSLGMRVVAEGVERAEQADWLRLQGCDHAQGFLFGEPMPAEAVPSWLRRQNRPATAAAAA